MYDLFTILQLCQYDEDKSSHETCGQNRKIPRLKYFKWYGRSELNISKCKNNSLRNSN